jgi:putative ATPase
VGKTTLARLLAEVSDAHFETVSAVLAGVKEIRQAVEIAKQQAGQYGKRTILFVDEVHRFNKSQQDAFLPYVEDGTLIFIGATTENPSFELNNACCRGPGSTCSRAWTKRRCANWCTVR